MNEIKSFWSRELFALDGFKVTVGVLILLAVLYWFLIMRK